MLSLSSLSFFSFFLLSLLQYQVTGFATPSVQTPSAGGGDVPDTPPTSFYEREFKTQIVAAATTRQSRCLGLAAPCISWRRWDRRREGPTPSGGS